MGNPARQVISKPFTAKKLGFAAAIAVISLLLFEGAARLWLERFPPKIDMAAVAGVADTHWFEILGEDLATQDGDAELYLPDGELFWKLRPNSSLDVENVVYRMRGEPLRWHLEVNANGHRGAPYPAAPAAPLIVALGDASTFGFRVDDEDTYPAQLQRTLRANGLPEATVINYGIPGYTSFQGRRLLEGILAQHAPDVVLLSFGAMDQKTDKLSDAQKAQRISAANLEFSHYFESPAIVRIFRRPPEFERTPLEDKTNRASPTEFRENMEAMIELAERSGARVILLDLVFVRPILGEVTAALAREHGLPRVEGRTLLRDTLLELLEGQRFQSEREVSERFWKDEIERYRPIYYSPSFFESLFADPVWNGLLLFFLVDPLHPNALGHRVIAEALKPLIVTGPESVSHR